MDFLSEIAKKLDLPPGEKAEVLKELESHYREVEEELTASGMDSQEVAAEAGRRLGDPQDVASRLQTVHCQATWRTAWLTVLPFLGLILTLPIRLLPDQSAREANHHLVYAFGSVMAAFAAIMIAGSIRELKAGRRPVWLATWLAVGVTLLISTIRLFSYESFWLTIRVDHGGYYYRLWTTGLQLLIIWPLATWASRGSIKCMVFAVVVLALVVAFTVHNKSIPLAQQIGWGVLFVGFAPSALLMLTATRLFSWHPYGTISQASLFLLVSYGYGFLDRNSPATAILAVPTVEILLAGVVAWIAVRASTQKHKLLILSWGVFLSGVCGSLVTGWLSRVEGIQLLPGYALDGNWIVDGIGMGLFTGSFYYLWIVSLPRLLSERWTWHTKSDGAADQPDVISKGTTRSRADGPRSSSR